MGVAEFPSTEWYYNFHKDSINRENIGFRYKNEKEVEEEVRQIIIKNEKLRKERVEEKTKDRVFQKIKKETMIVPRDPIRDNYFKGLSNKHQLKCMLMFTQTLLEDIYE